ncbi:MAG: hypothetical protein ACI4FX_12415 [Agathobacter sp.]
MEELLYAYSPQECEVLQKYGRWMLNYMHIAHMRKFMGKWKEKRREEKRREEKRREEKRRELT